jgi:hypothetical protein
MSQAQLVEESSLSNRGFSQFASLQELVTRQCETVDSVFDNLIDEDITSEEDDVYSY